jgi:hypothetical protein
MVVCPTVTWNVAAIDEWSAANVVPAAQLSVEEAEPYCTGRVNVDILVD